MQRYQEHQYQESELQTLTQEHNKIFDILQQVIDSLEHQYQESYETLESLYKDNTNMNKDKPRSKNLNSKLYSVNIGFIHSINQFLKGIMKILDVTKTTNDGRSYLISYHGYGSHQNNDHNHLLKNMNLELDAIKFCENNKFNTEISLYKQQMKDNFISQVTRSCSNIYTIKLKSLQAELESLKGQNDIMKYTGKATILQIEDADLHFIKGFKQLSVLDLENSAITDNTITLIKDQFQRVKQLNISGCYMLTDRALKILAYCENLVSLEISHMNGLTTTAILELIQNSNNLNYLDMTKNTQLKESILYKIYSTFSEQSSTLKWLEITSDFGIDLFMNQLTYLTTSNPGQQITDDELKTLIGQRPPKYTGLFFVSCQQLTKVSLELILKKCQVSAIKRVCFSYFIQLKDSSVQNFTLAMPNIEYLNLSHCYNITDHSLYYISKNLSLKHLILEKCLSITDEGLSHILINMESQTFQGSPTKVSRNRLRSDKSVENMLKSSYVNSEGSNPLLSLNLAYCLKITDKSILLVSSYCSFLKTLNLSHCEQVTDKSIDTLSSSLKFLENLNLNHCEGLTDSSISMVATRLPRLITLEIQWCQVSQKCVRYISENLNNLSVLNLSHCPGISTQELILVAKNVTGLTQLRLQSCENLEENGMMAVAQYLNHLQVFCVKQCQEAVTDQVIKILVNNNKNLQILDISWCRRLTNIALFYIAKSCFNLKSLNLNGCIEIDDGGIQWLSAAVSPIRQLNLTLCSNITDESIYLITQNLKEIRILSLSQLSQITDLAISSISNLPKLQKLQLRGCTKITSISLIGLLYNLQRLTQLNISECRSIEGESLNKICQFMGNIKVLQVSEIQVEDFFLQQLALYCSKLTQLNLCYCNLVSDEGVLKLIQKLPRLIKLSLQNTNISDRIMRIIAHAINQRKMQKVVID